MVALPVRKIWVALDPGATEMPGGSDARTTDSSSPTCGLTSVMLASVMFAVSLSVIVTSVSTIAIGAVSSV